jgi:hypothetical protein
MVIQGKGLNGPHIIILLMYIQRFVVIGRLCVIPIWSFNMVANNSMFVSSRNIDLHSYLVNVDLIPLESYTFTVTRYLHYKYTLIHNSALIFNTNLSAVHQYIKFMIIFNNQNL